MLKPRTLELYKFLGVLDDILERARFAQPIVHYKLPGGTEVAREFNMFPWTDPTPERAFLARVFVDKCIAKDARLRLDETLPVTTHMMFRIQAVYNSLVEHIQADTVRKASSSPEDGDDDEEAETRRLEAEIAASRQARMRRSTLGSRVNSVDLCESNRGLDVEAYP